jgi:hypothetical protein
LLILVAGLSVIPADLSANSSRAPVIVVSKSADSRELLAAREVGRYYYLRTGLLANITMSGLRSTDDIIVITTKADALTRELPPDKSLLRKIAGLRTEQYLLRTIDRPHGARTVLIIGGDDIGTLYGAYRFAEALGVRFYLSGDVVPDRRIAPVLPDVDEVGKPLFSIRGIQPFHDFPEGPDWWDRDDYLAYTSQLAKMRMNFIGLHTYPNAEPAVWIGLPSDIGEDGKVKFSYPSAWHTTAAGSWGYASSTTSDFIGGAAQLFASDSYGPSVMDGFYAGPSNLDECNLLFQRTGLMLHDVFSEARFLGVKTCIGTETPIFVPSALQVHLRQLGQDPASLEVHKELYEGTFRRIASVCPVDYYWLWTPEGWTWGGNTPTQLSETTDDLSAALEADKAVGSPFQLATCGWVLGPQSDRGALDGFLPKSVPMSSINRNVGNSPVDPAYAGISGRPKWAIPWLENDPQLTAPEPWAGRMRYDAMDALHMGCTGLIGIHWRTKAISINAAALADAAWDQSYAPKKVNVEPFEVSAGNLAAFNDPMPGTSTPEIYQTVRYDMDGYRIPVPSGTYTVTLQFVEPFYSAAGKRVFGVKIQGKTVIDTMDIFALVGKNHPLDRIFPSIAAVNGAISIDFVRQVEFPAIAGIVVSNGSFSRKINCGGPAVDGYLADNLPAVNGDARTMPIDDLYVDYATANFGPTVGKAAGEIMASVDGMNMPKPVNWRTGPGSITIDRTPWVQEAPRYVFVDQFAALLPKIQSPGDRDRFEYWLNTYEYTRAMAVAGCGRGLLDMTMDTLHGATDPAQKSALAKAALLQRIDLAREWEQAIRYLVATVSTPGELGTITNIEQQSRIGDQYIDAYDQELSSLLGGPLPPETQLSPDYIGPDRLIVPTVRTMVSPGEKLALKVIILSSDSKKSNNGGVLYFRALGVGAFRHVPLIHVGRSVYSVEIPEAPPRATAIEYYIDAGGQRFPATAPALNQTVTICPSGAD